MEKQFFVYIVASKPGGTIYIGVTSNLAGRVWQHRNHIAEGFTKRHAVSALVYYEPHDSAEAAIIREKQLKEWRRAWKVKLIESSNPHWLDLYESLFG